MVGGVANAAVTGVGAAATASTLTSTASGLKSLTTALSRAEENVAVIIGKLLKRMFFKKATKIDDIFNVDLTLCSKCQIDKRISIL